MNLFTKQKQTDIKNKQPKGCGGGINQEAGIKIHTAIYKTDNQQGPTIAQGTLLNTV